uniref:Uncharacterized protein n=1 Tax=Anopheles farauti TaxID=69004 RepID=A0A182QI62_9DIPT
MPNGESISSFRCGSLDRAVVMQNFPSDRSIGVKLPAQSPVADQRIYGDPFACRGFDETTTVTESYRATATATAPVNSVRSGNELSNIVQAAGRSYVSPVSRIGPEVQLMGNIDFTASYRPNENLCDVSFDRILLLERPALSCFEKSKLPHESAHNDSRLILLLHRLYNRIELKLQLNKSEPCGSNGPVECTVNAQMHPVVVRFEAVTFGFLGNGRCRSFTSPDRIGSPQVPMHIVVIITIIIIIITTVIVIFNHHSCSAQDHLPHKENGAPRMRSNTPGGSSSPFNRILTTPGGPEKNETVEQPVLSNSQLRLPASLSHSLPRWPVLVPYRATFKTCRIETAQNSNRGDEMKI